MGEFNKDNLAKVIEAMKTPEAMKLFNMSFFAYSGPDDESPEPHWAVNEHECGTPACIAGFTVSTLAPDKIEKWKKDWLANRDRDRKVFNSYCEYFDTAQELLGLDYDRAYKLFQPEDGDLPSGSYDDIRYEHAIAALEHLHDTGEIDWHYTAEE